ncbi:MAG: creatininase family protein [Pseudomonadota bacterium]
MDDLLVDSLLSVLSHFGGVFVPSSRIFGLYLVSAFVLAAVTFLWYARQTDARARPEGIERGLIGYIFDTRIFGHRSTAQDCVWFFFNGLIFYGVVAQLMVSAHTLYALFGAGLDSAFGTPEAPLFAATPLTTALYTLAAVLAMDFAVFLAHYLHHRLPWLWPFHAVHHSAEVLTPLTLFRMHPVDLFLTGLAMACFVAGAMALFVWLTGEAPSELTILGVNVVVFAFYLAGYNLRHSHIWLSYPPWLSHILISPAQHQTHHSVDEKHWDRNFGLIFAFWDWMFGTLYVPRGYERLTYGLSRARPNPYGSVFALMFRPFVECWIALSAPEPEPGQGLGTGRLRWIGLVLILMAAIGLTVLGVRGTSAGDQRPLPSVHLEALTWTEVDAALKAGRRAVIVPTAGIEQNGPHAILGKHAHIVRETAERIARALGDALVAPVIVHTPQGAIGAEAKGHMRWPGTISLPESVFEALLEASARSLASHGFTEILLIGDSGPNQEPQARVAALLAAEWAEGETVIRHIGDYYDPRANGQIAWLEARGFGPDEIGTHAGLRDTAELLAVHPEGVRAAPLDPPLFRHSGRDGNWRAATAEIGEAMLMLKVEAALREIRAARAPIN